MVSNIVFQLTGNASGIVAASNTASDAIKKTNSEVSKLDKALSSVGAAAAAYFSVQSIIAFGKEIVAVEVKLTSLRNRFEGLTGSAGAGTKEFERLQSQADKLGLGFEDLSESFINFAQSAKQMGVPLSQSRKMFDDLSKAIAGAHLSTEQQGQAMLAIQQMMSKGKVQAQELTLQLGQALPGAIGIMARSLGVTTGELNKMMEKGELLSSVVLPKFAKELSNTFGGQAELAAESLNGSINRASNAWIRLADVISKSAPTKSTIDAWANLLDITTEQIERLKYAPDEYRLIQQERNSGKASQIAIEKVLLELEKSNLTEGEKGIKLLKAANESLGREIELRKQLNILDPTGEEQKVSRNKDKDVEAIQIKIIKEKQYRDVLLDANKSILEAEQSAQAQRKRLAEESTQLTDKQKKELNDQKKALEDFANALRKLHNQAQIELSGGAKSPGGIVTKSTQDISELQGTKEFLALPKNEQDALVEAMRKTAREQIEAIIKEYENGKIKSQQILKEILDAGSKNFKAEDYLVGPVMPENVKENYQAQADKEKQVDLQKRNYRVEMAQSGLQVINNLEQGALQKKQKALDQQLAKGIISEATYQKELTKIKRKEAMAQKANAIASIAINTAVAVVSDLKAGGLLIPLIIGIGAAQAAVVASQPIAYAKGTKYVPALDGAVRGKDSVHALLMPGERVVPTAINETPGYRNLLDTIQDKKISPRTAQYLTDVATGKITRSESVSFAIDYDEMGKAVARYAPRVSITASQGVDINIVEKIRKARL